MSVFAFLSLCSRVHCRLSVCGYVSSRHSSSSFRSARIFGEWKSFATRKTRRAEEAQCPDGFGVLSVLGELVIEFICEMGVSAEVSENELGRKVWLSQE